MDGDQNLELYWIDPVDAMDRLVARPEFKGKIYLQYERQESEQRQPKEHLAMQIRALCFKRPRPWT